MRLKDIGLLLAVSRIIGDENIEITGIQMHHAKVKPGDLFFCIRGAVFDGHDYAPAAIRSGAAAIVAERELDVPVPQLVVKDSRYAMAIISAHFYGYPSDEMNVIGVTGTNGKTTTCLMIEHILSGLGYPTGLMGTVKIKIGEKEYPAERTTMESLELQRWFRQMREADAEYAVMEVSSHALELGRVKGVNFRTAVFTNLTQDHLDFHQTMEKYKAAKALLFSRMGNTFGSTPGRQKFAVLNADDPASDDFARQTAAQVITYGIHREADVRAADIRVTASGTAFTVSGFGGDMQFRMKLLGKFNVYNALAATAAVLAEGIPLSDIGKRLERMEVAPGRMETVDGGQPFLVIVDYAHTPDGLRNALSAIKEFAERKIICVFGCGGDRDRTKRPRMGAIAAELSDYVIVTSDNPRTEDPEAILRDIEAGLKEAECGSDRYELITDRRQAIQKAIEMASPKDVVLIAGKGHETYQIIGDRTLHFDDREEAMEAIRRRKP